MSSFTNQPVVAQDFHPAAKTAMAQQGHPPAILGHPASQAGWLSRNGSSKEEEWNKNNPLQNNSTRSSLYWAVHLKICSLWEVLGKGGKTLGDHSQTTFRRESSLQLLHGCSCLMSPSAGLSCLIEYFQIKH